MVNQLTPGPHRRPFVNQHSSKLQDELGHLIQEQPCVRCNIASQPGQDIASFVLIKFCWGRGEINCFINSFIVFIKWLKL